MRDAGHREHVLIVDDDDDTRETLREILEDEGYLVHSAVDGLDALLQLVASRQQPALILLDWEMPRMSGDAFGSRLRQLPQLKSIPVVLITASNGKDVEAAASWTVARLQKPLKAVELLVTIERALHCATPR
ncbi:MAG: response regulator [Myxococcaceae bacterium]